MKNKMIILLLVLITSLIFVGCGEKDLVDNDCVLTYKEMQKLSRVIKRKTEDKNPETTDEGNICGFIGKYNEAYVILIPSGGGIPEGRDYNVGGYDFWEPNPVLISVYYKNKVYSLSEAYEKKILSDENIKDIYNKYIKPDFYHYVLYSPDPEYQKRSLYGKGYYYYINIKEIPYILVANEDFSKVCYLSRNTSDDNQIIVDIYDEKSLITEEQILILEKYIPIIPKNN